MSTTRMPLRVEPFRLANSAETLEGDVPLQDMLRLVEAIGSQEGTCHAQLEFGVDAQRRRYIQGKAQARVMMPCLRCMQPMPVMLDCSILLGMVTDESLAAHLPREYDPLIVDQERLDLLSVIEDELLLSLPQSVYHDDSECAVSRDRLQSGEIEESVAPNPFSVLQGLKDKH